MRGLRRLAMWWRRLAGFLMGGDVVIGLILFAILLVVNFMVITKGSGRIAEVAARFSLDAMPGKQMAIDADLNAGLINEKTARGAAAHAGGGKSGFYGAMDGAAKFVRGDAIAGLIITSINIVGGLAIGLLRHGMDFNDAANTFTTLTVGDGLVTQIPALLVSTAAGIVVTKGGVEGRADKALIAQLGGSHKPLALAGAAAAVLATMPGLPALPFLALAVLAGSGAWWRMNTSAANRKQLMPEAAVIASPLRRPRSAGGRCDAYRHDPGGAGLRAAAAGRRRSAETDRADSRVAPVDCQRNGLRAAAGAHSGQSAPGGRAIRGQNQGNRSRARRVAGADAAGHGSRRRRAAAAGRTHHRARFRLAGDLDRPLAQREAALVRNCTVVDPPSVLATHLTELVRDMMPELLSYAETQKLLDDLPREHQKLVSDLIPGMISVGGVQRVLQALLAERVSIRDLPTILEGVHEASAGQPRSIAGIVAIVRTRLARQLCESHSNTEGIVKLIALSPEWETAFSDSLVGSGEDRQLAMAPTRLGDFMRRFREVYDANAADSPALLTSAALRAPVRAVVERIRPATPVLAQTEIHPRARIRTVGTI